MLTFMQAGGFPMWIILVFGLITLVAAGRFAYRPAEVDLGFLRAMTAATVFAALTGVTAALGAVFTQVPNHPEWSKSPDLVLIVMTGLGESTAPLSLGFAIVSLAWVLTAVGTRRLA